jgi:hypothetical protein
MGQEINYDASIQTGPPQGNIIVILANRIKSLLVLVHAFQEKYLENHICHKFIFNLNFLKLEQRFLP